MDVDDVAAARMAPLVGASPGEVAIMETLSANLHLMMASFYRPNEEKFKVILEGKAFPSDHVRIHAFTRDPHSCRLTFSSTSMPSSHKSAIMGLILKTPWS